MRISLLLLSLLFPALLNGCTMATAGMTSPQALVLSNEAKPKTYNVYAVVTLLGKQETLQQQVSCKGKVDWNETNGWHIQWDFPGSLTKTLADGRTVEFVLGCEGGVSKGVKLVGVRLWRSYEEYYAMLTQPAHMAVRQTATPPFLDFRASNPLGIMIVQFNAQAA